MNDQHTILKTSGRNMPDINKISQDQAEVLWRWVAEANLKITQLTIRVDRLEKRRKKHA